MKFIVTVGDKSHHHHAKAICNMMAEAAEVRGTGIAKRKPEYIKKKMSDGHAIVALADDQIIGFCYIESWEGKKYVANSGLIVHPDYRKTGLARSIKKAAFHLSKKKFPQSKLFGITTSHAVMKINSELGYKPVSFSELTTDNAFWKGCESCPNHDILQRTNRSMCLCTGMVCDLKEVKVGTTKPTSWELYKRYLKMKKSRMLFLAPKKKHHEKV